MGRYKLERHCYIFEKRDTQSNTRYTIDYSL